MTTDAQELINRVQAQADSAQKSAHDAFTEANRQRWGTAANFKQWPQYETLLMDNLRRQEVCAGQGAQLDALTALRARIETLIEFIYPVGTADRLDLEIEWQKVLADAMTQMETEIRQHELIRHNPAAASGLIIPTPR
jgi:hypothetical protein